MDNIFINDQKLFVNLPRFARSTWTLNVQSKVVNGGEPNKEHSKRREEASKPRLRSYAEVTVQAGASGGRMNCEGITPIISITPHEGREYWCNGAWVGKLKKPMAMEKMEDRISWDLGYTTRTKFLGDDMVLLTGLSDDKAQQIIKSETDGGNSFFYSFEKWRPGCRPNNRVVWLQVWGFPIEVWDIEHMKKVVSPIGDVIEPDDDTDDCRRLDRARLLVRTPLPPAIKKEAIVRIGDTDYRVGMVEEVGDDGDAKHRRTPPSGDWSEELTSAKGGDAADNDDSDTTFSYSPELSSKKMLLRSNHWSHDITSGYYCKPPSHPSPLDNSIFDDTCREKSEDRGKHNLGLISARVDPADCFAEKAEAKELTEGATLDTIKAGSQQDNGDQLGNILNCEEKAEKEQTLYGVSRGHITDLGSQPSMFFFCRLKRLLGQLVTRAQ